MEYRIGTFLGVSVHLPCLVVYLNDNRVKICCKLSILSIFINVRRINLCLESFTVLPRKIFRRCLTF